MQIQAKDQRTLDDLTPLMKAYQDAGERFVAAQRASERVGAGAGGVGKLTALRDVPEVRAERASKGGALILRGAPSARTSG
jgi:hypothetical protein